MDYESEEQQVEALKKWWEENGRSVILGVVIGAGAIGGWQWWGSHKLATAQDASDTYAATLSALSEEEGDVVEAAALAKSEHGDTLYAVMASLAAARGLVEKNDLAGAVTQLQWAVENAEQPDVAVISKIRLARVLGATGDIDAALAMLPTDAAAVFTGLIEEVRGDLYVAKGESDLARSAYQAALDSGQRTADANALNMKLDDLAVTGEDAS